MSFTPEYLKKILPLLDNSSIKSYRKEIEHHLISKKKSDSNFESNKLLIVMGPCSIHSTKKALAYGKLVKELQEKVKDTSLLVMRAFLEKPRTSVGWKGFFDNDTPFEENLFEARKLLLDLANIEVPLATEFLDPLIANFTSDLISWGFIGARTTQSQPHRLFASGMKMPIGFKNTVNGDILSAIHAAQVAKAPHNYLQVNSSGILQSTHSEGNPYSHIVLRGSDTSTNFHLDSILSSIELLQKSQIETKILVDCAHGNSNKVASRQKQVFQSVLSSYIQYPDLIAGMMLESSNTLSLTDPCLSFDDTEKLVTMAHNKILEIRQKRPLYQSV